MSSYGGDISDVRQALIRLKTDGLRYVKSRHLADELDMSVKSAARRMQAAEDEGWVERWGSDTRNITWTIEL